MQLILKKILKKCFLVTYIVVSKSWRHNYIEFVIKIPRLLRVKASNIIFIYFNALLYVRCQLFTRKYLIIYSRKWVEILFTQLGLDLHKKMFQLWGHRISITFYLMTISHRYSGWNSITVTAGVLTLMVRILSLPPLVSGILLILFLNTNTIIFHFFSLRGNRHVAWDCSFVEEDYSSVT